MKAKQYPSQAELNALFNYDPETGVLTWKKPKTNRVKIGDVASNLESHGYLGVGIGKNQYRVHRIIWIMNYGNILDNYFIDHINCIKSDNKLENLRVVSKSQNGCNRPAQSNNKSEIKGLYELKQKARGKEYFIWACEVRIKNNNTLFRKSNSFHFTESTKESQKTRAIEWLECTRAELHGEFTNHGEIHLARPIPTPTLF